jgi:hypothetical protein
VGIIFTLSAFVCLCASLPTVGQSHPHHSDFPYRPISSFNIQNLNMIDALFQLGQEQRIPIGIEYTDAVAFRSRISLREQNTSVGKLLDAITHPQGYSWLANGGIIIVTHGGAAQGRKNLLNLRISEFQVYRAGHHGLEFVGH